MRSIAISEFKARCLGLLQDVARTGEPIIVTKRGKPLARVVPNAGSEPGYPQQSLLGSVAIVGDVLKPALTPDAWEAVEGRLLHRSRSRAKPRKRP